ncbi:hypothetical protein A3218_01870 [Pseudomonas chlororaphis]|nr:hypothetical protein A3218_01870 [Pseudomonas chlororaphis]
MSRKIPEFNDYTTKSRQREKLFLPVFSAIDNGRTDAVRGKLTGRYVDHYALLVDLGNHHKVIAAGTILSVLPYKQASHLIGDIIRLQKGCNATRCIFAI